jgi:hypothetical protein
LRDIEAYAIKLPLGWQLLGWPCGCPCEIAPGADLAGESSAQGEPAKAKPGKNKTMQLGVVVPYHATDGGLDTVRDYAQWLEATCYDFLETPDHALGADIATRRDWDPDRNTYQNRFHDPFVLLGYVSSTAPRLSFSKSTRATREAGAAVIRR